jgi:hypothetical protein
VLGEQSKDADESVMVKTKDEFERRQCQWN